MREIARFSLLGVKCVPWSVPHIGTATGKGGTRRRFSQKDAALVAWQQQVTDQARIAMGDAPAVLGPVRIVMTFYRETPPGKRHGDPWEARVESAGGKPTKRGQPLPDLVNLFKGAEDALQGVIIGNDAQTCEIIARRLYGPQDGVGVAVYALEPGDELEAGPFAVVA